jgi:signal peptidase II
MDIGREGKAGQVVSDCGTADRRKTELPDRTAHVIFWSILLAGLALDLWTKQAVFAWLQDKPGQGAEIVGGFLAFQMALNTGAAFGIASGWQVFLIGVSVIALLVIFGVFFFGGTRQRAAQVALGLFAAGVSGNLWDRIFNDGQVRDFIDVVYWPGRHWHTFNVADSMLCLAVFLLVVATFFTDSSDRTRAQPQK